MMWMHWRMNWQSYVLHTCKSFWLLFSFHLLKSNTLAINGIAPIAIGKEQTERKKRKVTHTHTATHFYQFLRIGYIGYLHGLGGPNQSSSFVLWVSIKFLVNYPLGFTFYFNSYSYVLCNFKGECWVRTWRTWAWKSCRS